MVISTGSSSPLRTRARSFIASTLARDAATPRRALHPASPAAPREPAPRLVLRTGRRIHGPGAGSLRTRCTVRRHSCLHEGRLYVGRIRGGGGTSLCRPPAGTSSTRGRFHCQRRHSPRPEDRNL